MKRPKTDYIPYIPTYDTKRYELYREYWKSILGEKSDYADNRNYQQRRDEEARSRLQPGIKPQVQEGAI